MKLFSGKGRRRVLLALIALAVLYIAGYIVCRMNKTIAHYTASAGGQCSYHGVATGDYKIFSVAPAFEFCYTPLRYIEMGFWRIAKPLGGKC